MKLILSICVLIPMTYLMSGSVHADTDSNAAARENIMGAFPGLTAESITATPIDGLYQVMASGQISYVTGDGRYLFRGDLMDIVEERNLSEESRGVARKAAMSEVKEEQMIVFSPAKKTTHTISVFTDIDCGYCRKLHRQIAAYNDLGIEVRYMFFPRSGPNTDSWSKADNVWCSKDRNEALTLAKSGVDVEAEACSPTPVAQHYNLGRALGIRGTPAIVVESGELIPGYVPPDELIEYLEE